MKLKQELEEIKNKDLSNMTEDELKEYKAYLTNYNKNAEKRTKTKLWKLLYWACGTPAAFIGVSAVMSSVLNITKTLSFIPMITGYAICAGCLGVIGVFSLLKKKSIKNVEKIKQVSNEKLSEVDRQLSVLEFRKELKAEKEAEQAGVEVAKTVEQDLNNTQQTANTVKDQGLDR